MYNVPSSQNWASNLKRITDSLEVLGHTIRSISILSYGLIATRMTPTIISDLMNMVSILILIWSSARSILPNGDSPVT